MSLSPAQSQLLAKVLESRTIVSESVAHYKPLSSSFSPFSNQAQSSSQYASSSSAQNAPAAPPPVPSGSNSNPLANLLAAKEEECLLVQIALYTRYVDIETDGCVGIGGDHLFHCLSVLERKSVA